jgi:hypothetical protein
MRMNSDEKIAQRAIKTLQALNTTQRERALAELDPIRREMANPTPDNLRADAWLAVCALCEALALEGGKESDVATLHRSAIAKTGNWLASFA